MQGKLIRPLVIYHGNCADGFGAAWVMRKLLGADAEFFPGVYQQPPPDVTGRDVFIVDFSYKYDVLVPMSYKANSITILDHHKTAAEDLTRLPQFWTERPGSREDAFAHCGIQNMPQIAACFDMKRSGAMIAWDFAFPAQLPPQLLRHIQDRDLWLFQLEGTREIQANVFSYPYDFEVWDKLMATDAQTLRVEGQAIERKHHKDIAELVAVTKRRAVIGGVDVPVANLPYTLSSDAGHLMGKGEAFAACYYDTPQGRCFSLRSEPEFGMDVGKVAAQYGGGGHPNAAGFTVPFNHELAGFQ